ncbi:general secretion pathway protein GspB [Vibrio sp. 10N]|uniref:general secretion pathway protein GspB n=1 Tax=Vibrio sp. 10N TaxID=3058938 RepID=UPI0028131E87|nr:general secretion pathway protein GspB [Vibrio sp. 10N]
MIRITTLSLLVTSFLSSSLMAEPSGQPLDLQAPSSQTGSESAYSLLPYPKLSELKPLPKRAQSQAVVTLPTPSVAEASSNVGFANQPVPQAAVQPSNQGSSDEPFGLDDLDLSGLDPEIARKVAAAMSNAPADPRLSRVDHIALESNEARYRGRLPALNFQTHMYSSDVNRRWIKVNGQELKEGDRLNSVQLLAIEPQSVTIRFDNDIIDIPALYEWGG